MIITCCHRCNEPLTSSYEDYGIHQNTRSLSRYRCVNNSCNWFSTAISVDLTYYHDKLVAYWFVFEGGICVASERTIYVKENFLIGKVKPPDINGDFYDILHEENIYLDFNNISELEEKANRFLKLKSFW